MKMLSKLTKLPALLVILIVIQQVGQSVARRPKYKHHDYDEDELSAGETMDDDNSRGMKRQLADIDSGPLRRRPPTERPQSQFAMNSTLLAASCGHIYANRRSSRIAGGYDAKAGFFPSFVEVQATFTNPPTKVEYCGGVIIGDSHVLTAARCIDGAKSVILTAKWERRDPQEILEGQKWCPSRNYVSNTLANDFAIVKTKKKFWYDYYVQPACLPTEPMKNDAKARAVGMGYTDSRIGLLPDKLQVLQVNREVCKANDAPPNTVCFGSSRGSLCAGKLYGGGDAGAPIFAKIKNLQTVIALTSYGPDECKKGLSNQAVSVDVFSVRNEILDLMEATESSDRSCGKPGPPPPPVVPTPSAQPSDRPTKPPRPTRSTPWPTESPSDEVLRLNLTKRPTRKPSPHPTSPDYPEV